MGLLTHRPRRAAVRIFVVHYYTISTGRRCRSRSTQTCLKPGQAVSLLLHLHNWPYCAIIHQVQFQAERRERLRMNGSDYGPGRHILLEAGYRNLYSGDFIPLLYDREPCTGKIPRARVGFLILHHGAWSLLLQGIPQLTQRIQCRASRLDR